MPSIDLKFVREGEGAWPDLTEKAEEGKLIHTEQLRVAGLDAGMTNRARSASAATSSALRLVSAITTRPSARSKRNVTEGAPLGDPRSSPPAFEEDDHGR
jgi:hypothetical protein